MSLVFPFDPNIERASTIPARVYNDPVFLELERERIFARTWQLVGRAEQVREHGDYLTAEVGNDAIVVVRDGTTLRGFHNVCLHRAGPVGRLTSLVVDEPARGRGVGHALVQAAEARFVARGCVLAEVTSNQRRTDAHRFYERLGYALTSARFGKVHTPAG